MVVMTSMTLKLPLLCAGFARYKSRKLIRHPSRGRLAKLRVRLAHNSPRVLVFQSHRQPHRKRESLHHVSGCETWRRRLCC